MNGVTEMQRLSGFTVVELVIVLVVIGILTALGIVGFGKWQDSVRTNQVKSDLKAAAAAMEDSYNFNSTYPATVASIFTPSNDVTLTGGSEYSGTSFCINISSQKNTSIKYYSQPSKDGLGIRSGQCSDRLAAPAGLSSSNYTAASWSAVSGATSYELQRASNSTFTRGNSAVKTTTPNGTINAATSAPTLYLRVRAVAASGATGLWSTAVSVAGVNSEDVFRNLAFTTVAGAGARSWTLFTMSDEGTRMAAATDNAIFASKDGGATWVQSPNTATPFDALAYSGDGSRLLQGSDYAGPQNTNSKVMISGNGGLSWSASGVNRYVYLFSLSVDGRKVIISDTNYSNSYSLDGGYSWQNLMTPAGSSPGAQFVISPDGNKLFVYWYTTSTNNVTSTSTDMGATWTAGATYSTRAISNAVSYDGSKMIQGRASSGFYLSSNSGTSWTQATSLGNATLANTWRDSAISHDGSKMVVIKGRDLYTSIDSGSTWVQRTDAGTGWTKVKTTADGTKIVGIRGSEIVMGEYSS